MINLILSLIIGAAGWVASAFIFDSVWTGIIPFIVLTLITLVVLNRMTAKKISAIMAQFQSIAQNIPTLPSEQARKNQLDKAIEVIKKGYAYKNYQFFLEQQLNSQIGSIYYMQKKFDEAEPYLKDSFLQPGTARAMYGCLLFKKKKEKEMNEQFEKAVKLDQRTPLLYNVHAWCLNELKKRDEAIAVLNTCLARNPGDKNTQDNLDLLKNSGKMKMKCYELQWYQFMLEEPPRQMIMMNPNSKRPMFR